ncbi:hypothetical protein ACYFX5_12780 [Bremerella sp. T1]|uniref:hypothetical protein n=1 Tax=Bremerella sp. TYQ1 TaxID=3119568 RepID=UPI001CCD9C41|nr:hypothetical protein [Bremerella volcania]UBM33935.1 hypothetical protein LA756_14725 [Bremerella volcania]
MAEALELHHDVPCPGCGCLCDDLTLEVSNGNVTSIKPACAKAARYFQQPIVAKDACRIDGEQATWEEAVTKAADILRHAKAPLFFGLGESTSETVRRVIDLADRVGGVVDASHPTFYDPTGRILQSTGMVTCSLGEIRHRADMVIFWGCDPKTTHERHWQRYSVEPTGRFVPGGRSDRHVVGMGSANATTAECDEFIPLDSEHQVAALHHLVALAQKKPFNSSVIENQLGELTPALAKLHEQIQQSKYFVFVLGETFLQRDHGRVSLELLSQYVRPLHEQTRGAVTILRPGPNWVGAGGVVASRTGYPGSASLLQGLPQFDPDNFSAVNLLAQKRVDAAFLLAGEWLEKLPSDARQTLQSIPHVILGHRESGATPAEGVFLPIARPALNSSGTMSRMDDMPLPVREIVSTDLPTAGQTVQAILERLSA